MLRHAIDHLPAQLVRRRHPGRQRDRRRLRRRHLPQAARLSDKCLVDADCTSSACDADSLLCVASQCTDHQQDGNETDVDCGGGTCPPCADTERCVVATDCQSGSCNGGVCTACSSDANCGGATPACDTTTGVCEQCSATNNTECSGSTAVCDTTIDTCVQCTQASQCTTPPGNGCADATHVYAAACTTDTCSYSTGAVCTNGCYQDVCNGTGPSYDGDATGPASGSLDKEANLDPSVGFEAASTPITVDVYLTPHNAVSSVTLTYTTDDFNTTTPIVCVLNGTSGLTTCGRRRSPRAARRHDGALLLRLGALTTARATSTCPGNNVNYTYVTQ